MARVMSITETNFEAAHASGCLFNTGYAPAVFTLALARAVINRTTEDKCYRKSKMAPVHFTVMPCEPNTAYRVQRKPIKFSAIIFVPVPRMSSSLGLRIL